MTLGEILKQAAKKDITGSKELLPSGKIQPKIEYTEEIKDGQFTVKLASTTDPDAYIETSIPYDGSESTENYVRLHFLAMVFNAAVYGMKRNKKEAPKKNGREN